MATTLEQINARLKAAKVGVRVDVRGDRLCLQATLPPRPNSSKTCSYQQRITLGVKNNPAGLLYAERQAKKVGALLDCKEFDWTPYLKAAKPKGEAVSDWVVRFKIDYFSKRQETFKTLTTWDGDYQKSFNKLPQDQVLTPELLKRILEKTEPDTKTRKRTAMAFGAIARFAGLEFDSKPLAGKYSPRRVNPRDLPTDEEIVKAFHSIQNPNWKWVFGMIATYGLRSHETFQLDLDLLRKGERIITVFDGKTGGRRVWPYYPEWFEEWELAHPSLPNILLNRPNRAITGSCCEFFQGKIPFTLLNLRHGWAVRTLEFGLDLTLAAQQMGHSVQVHTDLYHHWITAKTHQRAFEKVISRPDRPLPPSVV
jgi:integrase